MSDNSRAKQSLNTSFLHNNSVNLLKTDIMDLQAEKLELVRMVLDTDNPGVLASVKRIFSESKKLDYWDKLPQYQKDEILKGVEEVGNGETIDYNKITEKHRK